MLRNYTHNLFTRFAVIRSIMLNQPIIFSLTTETSHIYGEVQVASKAQVGFILKPHLTSYLTVGHNPTIPFSVGEYGPYDRHSIIPQPGSFD